MKDFESLTVISVEYYCTVHLSRNVSINIECLSFLLLGVMIKDGAIRWFTNCSDLSVLDVCSVNSYYCLGLYYISFPTCACVWKDESWNESFESR